MNALVITFNNQGLIIQISYALVIIIIFLFSIFFIYPSIKKYKGKYKFEESEIGWGGFKLKIKPSFEDLQVAYKLWIEISTRKLGNKIDKNYDLIKKINESYYEFFKIARNILKEIPVEKITNKETQKIISLLLDILNQEIRPYLTKWHPEVEKWYRDNLENYKNLNPVEFEQKFPKYNELMEDLLQLNQKIIELNNSLQNLIRIDYVQTNS
jgi:hypothetical protein